MIIIDSVSVVSENDTKVNYGRQRIILDYDEVTPNNFLEVFQKALSIHGRNKSDCDYLINVFLGKQDILKRQPPNTSNINNTVVVNYAFPITRQLVGYTHGNPIDLIQKNTEKQESVQKLSDIFSNESSYTIDVCTAFYDSICGVGYQITMPNPDIDEGALPNNPIIIDYLDPRNTFVVQSTKIGNPQIMSCMEVTDTSGNITRYIAFTKDYVFTIDTVVAQDKFTVEENPIGLDPIVEFENSLFLTGDWEQALSVMNALNLVTSDSLNDIEGTIKSLLVLIGTDLGDDDGGENDITLSDIKTKRLLSLVRGDGDNGNLDAKFISPQLDSMSVQNVREFLEDARNVIVGIPDRSANSSGGDTGEAVINRDGWTDIEIVAKLKELFFKKAKRKQVAIAIKILQMLNLLPEDLSAFDVDITIGRHNQDNLGTRASAFATLVATGELAVIDCLEMSGLTTRLNEVVERGKKEKEEKREESLEYMKREAELTGEGFSESDADINSNYE